MARALTLAVVSLLLAMSPGCTKKNPKYCDATTPCAMGTCDLPTRECVSTHSDGGDVRDGDAGDGDAGDVRDTGPFKCMSSTQCLASGVDGGPVCDVDAGACVQCLMDGDCTMATKPICNRASHTCEPCTTDTQCAAKAPNPGVCMFHLDGRCATDAETIYVRNSPGSCSIMPTSGGTKELPYCSSQDGINAVVQGRSLVVMRGPDTLTEWSVTAAPAEPITVVGQASPVVSPGARVGIRVSAGNVSVRKLVVSGGTNVGVIADSGAELHMDTCTVTNNSKGGILLDGAAFEIKNSTITNNGPSADLTWGGVRIQNLLASGVARLESLTIQGNSPSGVSCTAAVSASGVSAMGNVTGDISMTCNFSSCGTPGAACGAP